MEMTEIADFLSKHFVKALIEWLVKTFRCIPSSVSSVIKTETSIILWLTGWTSLSVRWWPAHVEEKHNRSLRIVFYKQSQDFFNTDNF